MPHQLAQAGQQRAVAGRVVRCALRQHPAQDDGEGEHQGRGDHVDRPPAQQIGDQARHRAGEQDAGQQPAHHLADDLAALLGRGQVGGQRHQYLRDHGRRPHQHRDGEEHPEDRARRGEQQCGRRHEQRPCRQSAVLGEVAEREQEQQSQCVAGLGQRHHRRCRALADAEGVGHEFEQRLRVVEVGHGQSAGHRHDQGQCGIHPLRCGHLGRSHRLTHVFTPSFRGCVGNARKAAAGGEGCAAPPPSQGAAHPGCPARAPVPLQA